MESYNTRYGTSKYRSILLGSIILLATTSRFALSQNRIHYAGKEIFISGINVAWSSFGGDLGPDAPDLTYFQTIFKTVHNNGGNILRFWLHTNGYSTPIFDANGFVIGPGPVAIQNLRLILNSAQQNNVGLILCLWSHDMLNQSELDTMKLHRNAKLLTDTAYTNAYIRNSLTPMIDSLKGNPGIVAWEIFNEPEGITNEYGWGGRDHVPMASIQRCVNLMTGAIHRADPGALVTSGAVTFQTLTDVNPVSKISASISQKFSSLSQNEQKKIAGEFNVRHRTNLTTSQLEDYFEKISASANLNFYRDDRLIASGGDSAGTLDFYCVHYYAQNGSGLSPFVHPASYWNLSKPVVAAEFNMQLTDGVAGLALYPTLYQTGYAGGMVWSWTDFGNPATNSEADTWTSLEYMFRYYRNDVIINPTTGSIYVFEAANTTIEKTNSTYLRWDVEPGSSVKLNGTTVGVKDSLKVTPLLDTTYTLIANGQIHDTAKVTITVLPRGKIISFKALPIQIGTGENTWLIWHVVKGSTVTLNGASVPVLDTMIVYPTDAENTYALVARGDEIDSSSITITILPPDQVDRAFGADVIASSNDSVAYSFSNPQNIVDGNGYTRWQAASTPSGQSVRLDLGRSYSNNTIVIRWGNKAYASQYSVQASDNLSTWSLVKSVFGGTGGVNYEETLTNLAGAGRYWYFLLQAPGNGGAYSIAEIYMYGSPVTDVAKANSEMPTTYALFQSFPNPFNPISTIKYDLPREGNVVLKVYDMLGREVATLVNAKQIAGYYSIDFNASQLSSGVYFYRIVAGNFVQARKMVLIK